MKQILGNQIAMIFQEPMTSLNPVFTIGDQVSESIILHNPQLSKADIKNKAVDMLRLVGIPAPEKRYHEYPHHPRCDRSHYSCSIRCDILSRPCSRYTGTDHAPCLRFDLDSRYCRQKRVNHHGHSLCGICELSPHEIRI